MANVLVLTRVNELRDALQKALTAANYNVTCARGYDLDSDGSVHTIVERSGKRGPTLHPSNVQVLFAEGYLGPLSAHGLRLVGIWSKRGVLCIGMCKRWKSGNELMYKSGAKIVFPQAHIVDYLNHVLAIAEPLIAQPPVAGPK